MMSKGRPVTNSVRTFLGSVMWDPRHPGSLGISRDEAESLCLSLSHSQRTLRLAHTLYSRLTFQLTLSERTTPEKNPTENGVVIYRSPRSGQGLDGADVTVRPGWPGLPWGSPFLGRVSAMPGSPPTPRVWIRQKGTAQRFCLGKREEGTVVQNKRGEMIYKPN